MDRLTAAVVALGLCLLAGLMTVVGVTTHTSHLRKLQIEQTCVEQHTPPLDCKAIVNGGS